MNFHKAKQYEYATRFLFYVAEHGFFEKLQEQTKRQALILAKGFVLIDAHIDALPLSEKEKARNDIVAYLQGGAPLSYEQDGIVADMKSVFDSLPEQNRKDLLEISPRLLKYGEAFPFLRSARTFVEKRLEEALDTAAMLTSFAPEFGGNKRFVDYLKTMTIAINFADSFYDAKKDFKNGDIAISPTKLRFAMAACSLVQLGIAVKNHPDKKGLLQTCSYGVQAGMRVLRHEMKRPRQIESFSR